MSSDIRSNKNGYEIRAEMLELAANILQFEYTAKQNVYLKDIETEAATKKPTPPTTDDVVAQAQKLYEFVNKNENRARDR